MPVISRVLGGLPEVSSISPVTLCKMWNNRGIHTPRHAGRHSVKLWSSLVVIGGVLISKKCLEMSVWFFCKYLLCFHFFFNIKAIQVLGPVAATWT